MAKEYIEKATLYHEIAELEELARKRVIDTPTNSPAYTRYYAQLTERTALKHKIFDTPASSNVVEVVRCKDCRLEDECCRNICTGGHRPDDFCSYGERKGGAYNERQP